MMFHDAGTEFINYFKAPWYFIKVNSQLKCCLTVCSKYYQDPIA